MESHLLYPHEWRSVCKDRGTTATGYPYKRLSNTRGYYWSHGTQPDKSVLDKIARACPLKAAEAFLKHYKRRNMRTYMGECKPPIPITEGT